jgi:hypothetical protein
MSQAAKRSCSCPAPEVTTGFPNALDAGGTLRVRAAFWLPLLALFNARQAELAGLTVANVKTEPETQTPLLFVTKRRSSHCLKSRLHMVHYDKLGTRRLSAVYSPEP